MMGKTRRKEKIYKDHPPHNIDEYIYDAFEAKKNRRKKTKQPVPPSEGEYDHDEDYGSFEKMSKRT